MEMKYINWIFLGERKTLLLSFHFLGAITKIAVDLKSIQDEIISTYFFLYLVETKLLSTSMLGFFLAGFQHLTS